MNEFTPLTTLMVIFFLCGGLTIAALSVTAAIVASTKVRRMAQALKIVANLQAALEELTHSPDDKTRHMALHLLKSLTSAKGP